MIEVWSERKVLVYGAKFLLEVRYLVKPIVSFCLDAIFFLRSATSAYSSSVKSDSVDQSAYLWAHHSFSSHVLSFIVV